MTPTVHLINPMWNAFGGSERRTRDLARLLAKVGDVRVWSEHAVDARLAGEVDVAPIGPDFPRGGVLVVVGVYFSIGPWLARAKPERVVMIVNTPSIDLAHVRMIQLLAATGCPIEVAYASEQIAAMFPWPGEVQVSPIDLAHFVPPPARAERPFTIGRLSRDEEGKHHAEDSALYARAIDAGMRVRVMGGTSLRDRCPSEAELLDAGAEEARDFLWSLDAFVFRTALFEASARVISEAMACGLPIVCGRPGGYTETVRDGVDGFVFDTTDEALARVTQLSRDPGCARAMGESGRARVLEQHARLGERLADFYFAARR
jgi:glycosyltransferase involved in cell wall biosynthesis